MRSYKVIKDDTLANGQVCLRFDNKKNLIIYRPITSNILPLHTFFIFK